MVSKAYRFREKQKKEKKKNKGSHLKTKVNPCNCIGVSVKMRSTSLKTDRKYNNLLDKAVSNQNTERNLRIDLSLAALVYKGQHRQLCSGHSRSHLLQADSF